MISRYESGMHRPSVDPLERLLAGCGMRLRLSLVPEPGLEDEPTRELLSLAPSDRLPAVWLGPLLALVRACPSPGTMLVGGKAAARIRGAALRVLELDVWFSDQLPIPAVAQILGAAGAADPTEPEAGLPIFTFADLLNGRCSPSATRSSWCGGDRQDNLELEAEPWVSSLVTVMVAGVDDCAAGWYPRDRDHLALPRAVRISAEIPGSQAAGG